MMEAATKQIEERKKQLSFPSSVNAAQVTTLLLLVILVPIALIQNNVK